MLDYSLKLYYKTVRLTEAGLLFADSVAAQLFAEE